jgi:hypothetical protein
MAGRPSPHHWIYVAQLELQAASDAPENEESHTCPNHGHSLSEVYEMCTYLQRDICWCSMSLFSAIEIWIE